MEITPKQTRLENKLGFRAIQLVSDMQSQEQSVIVFTHDIADTA